MPKKINVRVIKVPLSEDKKRRVYEKRKSFPKLPRLYLELVENRSKIRSECLGLEYSPKQNYLLSENDDHKHQYEGDSHTYGDDTQTLNSGDEFEQDDIKHQAQTLDVNHNYEDQYENTQDDDEDPFNHNINVENERLYEDQWDHSDLKQNQNEDENQNLDITSRPNIHETHQETNDIVSDRLHELLEDNKPADKYSIERKHNIYSRSNTYKSIHKKQPPSLIEIQGISTDINQENTQFNEATQDNEKRELIFKFDLLRKSYPDLSIPEYTIHSDMKEMKFIYNQHLKSLSVSSSVENYKTYLVGGFMVVEYIFGHFLKLDMKGFAQQQMASMSSYKKLLMELGEKSYVPEGNKKWPVEIRLLFLIIMNAGIFVVGKLIMKKTGSNIMNMMSSFNKPKENKMKGPDIDLNNLDNIP